MDYLFVALGSAVGGVGRYAVSSVPVKSTFPLLTLLVNVIGAVVIGFIAGIATQRPGLPRWVLPFWKTGVCGGFTTFSTFSLEACDLIAAHLYWTAAAYIAASVAGSLLGVLCGMWLGRLTASE